MKRLASVSLLIASIGSLVALPVAAQITVSVQDPQFSWTGKAGQQANFSWSATVDNPAREDFRVRVTLELLDSGGNVVGGDSTEVSVGRESRSNVDEAGSIEFASAQQARQYRIVIAEIES